jgi:hypothetical protein
MSSTRIYTAYRARIANIASLTPHPIFPEITINALFRHVKNRFVALGHERISKNI